MTQRTGDYNPLLDRGKKTEAVKEVYQTLAGKRKKKIMNFKIDDDLARKFIQMLYEINRERIKKEKEKLTFSFFCKIMIQKMAEEFEKNKEKLVEMSKEEIEKKLGVSVSV